MRTLEGNHTPKPPRTRILIVEDHPLVRQSLALLIGKQPDLEVCGEADTVSGALRLAREVSPDLAVVDLSLKQGSGIDLIKLLRARYAKMTMIAASAHEESIYATRALRAGASGYVHKGTSTDEILTAIRSVLKGDIYLSPTAQARILREMTHAVQGVERSPLEELTDREIETYEYLGRGLTTAEISRQMHVSPRTVDRYRDGLRRKLKLSSMRELVRQAMEWVMAGSPADRS